jgi:hypothetical protein
MNSFDVFDTLIARRYGTTRPIFVQISREFGIEDFVEKRVNADTGALGLHGIYEFMGIGAEVMARELELEHEHAFPIQENIDRVRHGDLLISDMYLPACDILSLVRSVGLDKQVTLYQSNSGKRTGDVWRRIRGKKPDLHLGDNNISDVEIPKLFGIKCEIYKNAELTDFEMYLLNSSLPSVAFLMRELRLRGRPNTYWTFYYIACQLNLPWLFVTAEILRRKTAGPKVFLGRDCQLLYYIYKNYFEYSYYLPFSRKLAYGQPKESLRYLLTHAPASAHYIDLGSTGGTWERLQAPVDVTVALYIDNFQYTPNRPKLPDRFSYIAKCTECPVTNATLELFNCGDHGYISEIDCYDDDLFRAVFCEHNEVDADILTAIHAPVKASLPLASFYRPAIRAEMMALDDAKLLNLFKILLANLCRQQHVERFVAGRNEREGNYLAQIVGMSA